MGDFKGASHVEDWKDGEGENTWDMSENFQLLSRALYRSS